MAGVVWRIHPAPTSTAMAIGVLMGKEQTVCPLEILLECTYEFDWLLYALAQPESKSIQAQTDGSSAL